MCMLWVKIMGDVYVMSESHELCASDVCHCPFDLDQEVNGCMSPLVKLIMDNRRESIIGFTNG